jgi:YVTN family beta-propeller protein
MKMMLFKQKSLFIFNVVLSSVFIFSSCKKDENTTPAGRYQRGVFILNEGAFGSGNGEISFFDTDSNKVVNNVFAKENGSIPLGDVIQSMTIQNNTGYIVANNSNKVVVVNPFTFKQTGEIKLKQPRYMVTDGNTGYITEWVNNNYLNPPKGRVGIIDLQTNTTLDKDTITTNGFFPDKLVFFNNRLYVLNSLENTVSILNTQTKVFEKKIIIGNSPSGIILDKNNDLWIMTSGKADYSNYPVVTTLEAGKLMRFKINGADLTLQNNFTFPAFGGGDLIINNTKDRLYYSFNGKVFAQDITANSLDTQPFIERKFYGIGIDPNGSVFYGGVAPDFKNNGRMIRYSINTKAKIDSATVGIAPNGFVFK